MRKIISGQSFLYRKNGYHSTIIEVIMKDRVRGDYLQMALSLSLQRFPYLSDKLVEKKGSYYLCEDLNSMTINSTKKLRTLGSMQTGYHLLDVTYTGKNIRVAFHHGLCDGRGIKPFVETLIYYYCTLKYKRQFDTTGIHTVEEKISENEIAEPFGTEYYKVDEENIVRIDKECFSLPENTENVSNTYRTEIVIDEQEFINYAKSNNATPTILTAILFSKAILENNDIDKKIMSNIAIDLRSYLGMEKTHKNCTGTLCLPFTKEDDEKDLKELSIEYRDIIAKQRDENFIKSNINKQIGLFKKIDELKTLEEKRKMLSFFDNISNDTFVISYLGKMQFNDFNQYVDSTHFYSDGSRGIIINMVASGVKLSFNILQNFEDSKYVDCFTKILSERNINFVSRNVGVFSTGKDKSFITASHQAERYYK